MPDGAPPLLSVMLGPGDALYLPRGYIHAAETNERPLDPPHVGVLAATAYDVLRDVLELAAEEPESSAARCRSARRRASLPRSAELVAAAARLACGAAGTQRLHDAVRPRLTNVAGPEPLGMLAAEDALRRLDKDTTVRPRRGSPPRSPSIPSQAG